jgi:hypothetical protein
VATLGFRGVGSNVLRALRERNKGPTASNYADGNLSGPSAQHEDAAGKLDHRRHMIAIGIGRAVPERTFVPFYFFDLQ